MGTACDGGGQGVIGAGPPLRVLAVEATTLDAGVVPIGANTFPAPTTAFSVVLDRYLDPATVSRQAICIQSSTAAVRTLADCTAGLLLRPTYDPVRRRVTYYQETDTSRLAPQTLYRLTVLVANEATGDFGFRAIDGEPLEGPFAVEFLTGEDSPEIPTENPPSGPLYCGTPECLATCEDAPCRDNCSLRRTALAACAAAGCHSAAEDAPAAAMGLDMSSAAAIRATALGQVAHQTQRGPGGTRVDQSLGGLGRALPIVAPGDPGRSYLLYKILASPDFAELDPALAPGEAERLQASVTTGMPMPPYPYDVPTPEQLDHLVRWIAAGADVEDCF